MPIRIQADLPAIEVLESENIFVMTHERANLQDIRPLKIAILNLMPTKIETETQLLRLLGNTPLQVDVELLHPATHVSKNTSSYHLNTFYKTFADVKDQKFDGLIITGAPVEKLPFEEVDYWDEMCQIMEWSKENVYSVLHLSLIHIWPHLSSRLTWSGRTFLQKPEAFGHDDSHIIRATYSLSLIHIYSFLIL